METFLFLLELAGTVAFAVSGAVLGIEKHMDIFGVGLLCHTLRFADGADTVTRTRVAWRDGAFSVSYTDTYAVTSLTLDGGRLTYVYDMPDNPPGTDHDGHIDTQETFTVG